MKPTRTVAPEGEWDLTPKEIEELKARIAEAERAYKEGRYYTMEEARQILEIKWAAQEEGDSNG